jgi:hypothetical protein
MTIITAIWTRPTSILLWTLFDAYEIQIDDIAFAIDMAIPCGLIINELLSNALKYAFPNGRPGSISVELRQQQPGFFLLRVADDGVGLPEGMDYEKTDSLGLKLVVSLVRQLRGEIEQRLLLIGVHFLTVSHHIGEHDHSQFPRFHSLYLALYLALWRPALII